MDDWILINSTKSILSTKESLILSAAPDSLNHILNFLIEDFQDLKDLSMTCKFFNRLIKLFLDKNDISLKKVPYVHHGDIKIINCPSYAFSREMVRNPDMKVIFEIDEYIYKIADDNQQPTSVYLGHIVYKLNHLHVSVLVHFFRVNNVASNLNFRRPQTKKHIVSVDLLKHIILKENKFLRNSLKSYLEERIYKIK